MICEICNSESREIKKILVRKKYEAHYFLSDNCGFMSVNNPTWLKEAYEKPINIGDTGYVMRNVYLSKKVLLLFSFLFGTKPTYLDYAGGYGVLARLMRDYGLNFVTHDPYTPNLFAQGFEYRTENISAITCFECFEHLTFPLNEIEKMLKISKNIFLSTRLLPDKTPEETWEYYGQEHGQHVSFYSRKTLQFIAKKYNLHLYTNKDNLHLFTQKKLPPFIFTFILFLSKLQFDIILRKFLRSKTSSDSILVRDLH